MRETVQLVPQDVSPTPTAPSAVVVSAGTARPGDIVVGGARDSRPTLRTIGLITAGVGVASIGVGTYFGIDTFSLKSQRDSHCKPAGCDPTGLSLDRQARTAASVSDLTLAVGVPLALLGAYLFYRGATDAPPTASAIRLVPRVGQHGAAISAEGAW